jgi:hypothetical protein
MRQWVDRTGGRYLIATSLITQNEGMTQRNLERARGQQAQFDDYVRETAAGGRLAAEIEGAKRLLDSGAISRAEAST